MGSPLDPVLVNVLSDIMRHLFLTRSPNYAYVAGFISFMKMFLGKLREMSLPLQSALVQISMVSGTTKHSPSLKFTMVNKVDKILAFLEVKTEKITNKTESKRKINLIGTHGTKNTER